MDLSMDLAVEKDRYYADNRNRVKIEKNIGTRTCWFCGHTIERNTDCVKNVVSSVHKECWLVRQLELFGKDCWTDEKIQKRLLEALSRRV